MKEFSYEILEEVAVLSENARGWRKVEFSVGMVVHQNLICVSGPLITKNG